MPVAALLLDDSAATMVEYSIMVALIALVCVIIIAGFGKSVSSQYSSYKSAISGP